MADEVIGFNERDADALVRLIDSSGDGGGINKPKLAFADFNSALLIAYATSGVSARSGTTLGTGTVAVKYLGYSGASRVILDAGYTVSALNLSTGAVASGVYIIIARVGDAWIVIWEEC